MNEDTPSSRRRRPREQTPLQRALGLLVRREHSRRELVNKLEARDIEPEQAQAAVERLAGEGWQDDTRFAESLVRSRAGGGYGPLHVRAELGTHGLPGELIEQAMAGYEGDWEANARELVQRRFGGVPEDPARRRKAIDLLARRGFPADILWRVIRGGPDD
ncbi:recombination regulator RecX [Xanthomonas massiliensis]|uniref:recombination regulator RecX n=1 Tax=Xanthomonas massiliensis TaxID=1720302 RepID=UPI0008252399|nr:recombination regulator RecX [Xanthomonas massiliensis]